MKEDDPLNEHVGEMLKKIDKEKVKNTFSKILDKIEDYHKEFDKLLKGTTDVEKAFIIATYVWDLNVKSRKKK
jgi:chaperonin cofactor prefoldin